MDKYGTVLPAAITFGTVPFGDLITDYFLLQRGYGSNLGANNWHYCANLQHQNRTKNNNSNY